MKPEQLQGKVVQFNERCKREEVDFDVGMKARIIGVQPAENNCFRVLFDFKEFEEANKLLAQPGYWDKDGKPTLRWHETNHYPKDCKYDWYIGADALEKNEVCFDLADVALKLKAKEIRHAIAEILAAHQINVTGQIDSELDKMLLENLIGTN